MLIREASLNSYNCFGGTNMWVEDVAALGPLPPLPLSRLFNIFSIGNRSLVSQPSIPEVKFRFSFFTIYLRVGEDS